MPIPEVATPHISQIVHRFVDGGANAGLPHAIMISGAMAGPDPKRTFDRSNFVSSQVETNHSGVRFIGSISAADLLMDDTAQRYCPAKLV